MSLLRGLQILVGINARNRAAERRVKRRPPSAHPRLEILERRDLLSVSDPTAVHSKPLGANPVNRDFVHLVSHGNHNLSATSPDSSGLNVAQIRAAYSLSRLSEDGAGQVIAIVDPYDDPALVDSTDPNFDNSDLHKFDQQFGLSDPPSFAKVNQNSALSPLPGAGPRGLNNQLEISLDVEWAHALAPQATIVLFEANSNDDADMYAAVAAAAAWNGTTVVSMSWGQAEFPGETSYDSYFTTPSGHAPGGITFIAAAGDGGAPGDYPAFSPNVLAVGGTTLTTDSSGDYLGEQAWNNGKLATGGGYSQYEPQPAFQRAVIDSAKRTIPDVSFAAEGSVNGNPAGVWIYDSYDFGASQPWGTVIGTSFSAPAWAAMTALSDQARTNSGAGALNGAGQTLESIYGALPQSDFQDITAGNNNVGNGGYTAASGYDLTTGRGTPVGAGVVGDLAGVSAEIQNTDFTTQGNWKGIYATDGGVIEGDWSSTPSYAQVSIQSPATWTYGTPQSTYTSALLRSEANDGSRIASQWTSYNGQGPGQPNSSITMDVNMSDGNAHQIALYVANFDYPSLSRSETITVVDPESNRTLYTCDLRNLTTTGEYLLWTLSGHVQVKISNDSGSESAVASGLFFGTSVPAAASFFDADTSTQGDWKGRYGVDGAFIEDDSKNTPSYAQVNVQSPATWVYTGAQNGDASALIKASTNDGSKIASSWLTFNGQGPGEPNSTITVDVNLTDGDTHRVALYAANFDYPSLTRSETIRVLDAATGAVLYSDDLTNLTTTGDYIAWDLSGRAQIVISNDAGSESAVASGLFFGMEAAASAALLKTDTVTQGNWKGVYGSSGAAIANNWTSTPTNVEMSIQTPSTWTFTGSQNTDASALLKGSTNDGSRIASYWNSFNGQGPGQSNSTVTFDLNWTDSYAHPVALYVANFDYPSQNRSETIQIVDPATGNILYTTDLTNISASGEYLQWYLGGHVQIVIRNDSGSESAVASGLFFA